MAEREFDLTKYEGEDEAPFRDLNSALTLWVPKEKKRKFELLQRRSKKDFGKHVARLICAEIDKVSVEE